MYSASPIGDLIPALLVLEAKAVLREQMVPNPNIQDFIEGYRKTAWLKTNTCRKYRSPTGVGAHLHFEKSPNALKTIFLVFR